MRCFGNYRPKKKLCANCEFLTSCQIYQQLGKKNFDGKLGFVSLEAAPHLIVEGSTRYTPYEELSSEQSEELTCMLAEFARFLLSLDEYSLAIICEIIVRENDMGSTSCTVTQLAEEFNISRWAMHKKILKMIKKNPELFALFNPLLIKLQAARRKKYINNQKKEQNVKTKRTQTK